MSNNAKAAIIARISSNDLQQLYNSGLNMRLIGERFGLTAATVCRLMQKFHISARKKGTIGHHWGDAHHNWKGSESSYDAFHLRLNRRYGKPSKCAHCNTTDPSCIYEWANLTGDYANELDYLRLCRSCHRKYDHQRRKREGRETKFELYYIRRKEQRPSD